MDINPVDFRTAFTLPPEDAVAYLEGKGYVITSAWNSLLGKAHNIAFTSAGILRMDILVSLKTSLTDSLGRGETFEQWTKNLPNTLAAIGVGDIIEETNKETGETKRVELTPYRLETIYRTNTQSALNAGHQIQQEKYKDERPYRRFNFVDDSRQSDVCAKLQSEVGGKAVHHTHSIMSRGIGPNHYNCRTSVSSLSASEVKRKGMSILGKDEGTEWTASEGFNQTPVEGYVPAVRDYPSPLVKGYRKFLSKRRKELDEKLKARGIDIDE